jgi:hypothetical protein
MDSRIADGGDDNRIRRVAANIFNKKSRTTDKGWLSSLVDGLQQLLTVRNRHVTKYYADRRGGAGRGR